MGDAEKGIEGFVHFGESWVACERVFEKAKAYKFGAELCERVQFFDFEHEEPV